MCLTGCLPACLPAVAGVAALQGVGAPACATILTAWFAAAERGTYWGMWNIAHNLGGFLAPVIVGEWNRSFAGQTGDDACVSGASMLFIADNSLWPLSCALGHMRCWVVPRFLNAAHTPQQLSKEAHGGFDR